MAPMSDHRENRRLVEMQLSGMEPCPFCASTNLGFYEYVYAQTFTIVCKNCGAQGPRRSSHDEALKLWNLRTTA